MGGDELVDTMGTVTGPATTSTTLHCVFNDAE
jgi:hypothetical protein